MASVLLSNIQYCKTFKFLIIYLYIDKFCVISATIEAFFIIYILRSKTYREAAFFVHVTRLKKTVQTSRLP